MIFGPGTDWSEPGYLREGSPRQRAALDTLLASGLLAVLAPWTPVLVGTIPLDIDVDGSDLDVLCCTPVHEFDALEEAVADTATALGAHDRTGHRGTFDGLEASVTRFTWDGEHFEVFGQPVPVARQTAYRHMQAEAALLAPASHATAERVRALKARGWRTEPAVAEVFGLPGSDPYRVLLELADGGGATVAHGVAGRSHLGAPSRHGG